MIVTARWSETYSRPPQPRSTELQDRRQAYLRAKRDHSHCQDD
jgi:hypothetical protein